MAKRRRVGKFSPRVMFCLPRILAGRRHGPWANPLRTSPRTTGRRSSGLESLEARQVLAGDLVISEFMASNDTGLRDEDQNRSDWIEVLNTSDEDINLNGWFLTDDPDDLDRWQFPSVNLQPDQRLVVFASGKHRQQPDRELHTNFRLAADGGYLALVQPDGVTVEFDFGASYPPQIPDVAFGLSQPVDLDVPLVSADPGTLFVPSPDNGGDTLGTLWTSVEFDDTDWTENVRGIGYERSTAGIVLYNDYIDTNVESATYGINQSAYLRFPFSLEHPENVYALVLSMQYDDGYVAYINGQEVARRNAPETLAWNSGATEAHGDRLAVVPEDVVIDVYGYRHLLRSGENVLAIHALNDQLTSSDFLMIPRLAANEFEGLIFDNQRYFVSSTPGLPNHIGSSVAIVHADHSPNVPNEGDPLQVTAKLSLTVGDTVPVTLHYRVMFEEEIAVPMYDDGLHADGAAGDGLFGATIPPGLAAPGEMMRYRITAGESLGAMARSPLFTDPTDTAEYYGTVVYDPSIQSLLPVMHTFVEDPAAADRQPGARASFFFEDKFYDNVEIDPTGRSVGLSGPKKSHDVFFTADNWLEINGGELRMNDFHVITDYFDREKMRVSLGYETFTNIGTPSHLSFPVRWDQNGEFYGTYFFVDGGNEQFLTRAGLDPGGALYKMNLDFSVATGSYKKLTRRHEDVADLRGFFAGLKLTGDERRAYLMDNINIPAAINFLVGLVIAAHGDCCQQNLYLYRDAEGSGEWQPLPYDLDSAFGRGGVGQVEPYYVTQASIMQFRANVLITALFEDVPGFKEMYLRRIRSLMDEFIQPPGTAEEELKLERRIDDMVQRLSSDALLDFEKWGSWTKEPDAPTVFIYDPDKVLTWEEHVKLFRDEYMPQRRAYLYRDLTAANGGVVLPPQTTAPTIEITHVEFNPDSGNQDEEYVQLTNPNDVAVDMSGWRLAGGIEHTFHPGTVLAAGATLYVSPNVNAFRARTTGPSGGQGLFIQGNYQGHLPNQGSTIALVAPDGTEVGQVATGVALTPEQQFLRISEVMYHPRRVEPGGRFEDDDFEFIELVNTSTTETLDLQHVALSGGVAFQFPSLLLAPGERVVVVQNEQAFAQRYGAGINVAGQYGGTFQDFHLSNAGETIRLEIGSGDLIQEFKYQDDWQPKSDGAGYSLTIVDDQADLDRWNLAAGWQASAVLDGTPGRAPSAAGDFDGDGQLTANDINLFCGGLRSANTRFDLTGDGVVDRTDLVTLVEDLMGAVFGDANLDGVFDSRDLQIVLQSGEYEDGVAGNSAWAEGDWDCDGDFTTSDLILALESSPYRAVAATALPRSVAVDAVLAHASADSPWDRDEKASRRQAKAV